MYTYAKFIGISKKNKFIYMQNQIYILSLQVASKNFKCINRQSLWVASKKSLMYIYTKSNMYAKFVSSFQKFQIYTWTKFMGSF